MTIISRLEFEVFKLVYVTKSWSEMPKPKSFKHTSEDGSRVKNTNVLYVTLSGSNAKFADFWPKNNSRNSSWKLDPFTTRKNLTRDWKTRSLICNKNLLKVNL